MGGCQVLGPSRPLLGLRGGCGARLLKTLKQHEYQKSFNIFSEPTGKEVVSGVTDDSPLNFPRWLIIEAAEPAHSLLKLSPFVLGKALTAQIGSLKSVKRLYKGDILVETDKATYSKMLLGLTQLAGVPVKSQPPQITERQPRSDPLEGHCRLQRQGNCRGATPTGSDRCRDHQMETANVAQTR